MICGFNMRPFGYSLAVTCHLSLLAWAAVLSLSGCDSLTITNTPYPYVADVRFTDLSQAPNAICDSTDPAMRARCTPELLESLKFVEIGKTINVVPVMRGSGTCNSVSIDFGDGTPPAGIHFFDVNSTVQAPHIYKGWPGIKLVRVKGHSSDCGGDVKKEITVGLGRDGLTDFRLGFAPTKDICNEYAPTHEFRLRRGSVVRIATNGMTINYGGNKIFDASGDPSSPVPAGYHFPNQRKHSVVYRVGQQLVQGEAGTVFFKVEGGGFLEICVNDNPNYLDDNTGGMRFDITVSEVSAY